MRMLEDEKEGMKREIQELRDRLEENEWQKRRLEEKLQEKISEVTERQQNLEGGGEERGRTTDKERLKRIEDKILEVAEQQLNTGGGGGGEATIGEERLK